MILIAFGNQKFLRRVWFTFSCWTCAVVLYELTWCLLMDLENSNHFLNFSYTRLEVVCLDFLRELRNTMPRSI